MNGSVQKKTTGADGLTSYRLFVSGGFDETGKRVRYSKTIRVKSDKHAEEELALFLSECEKGLVSDLPGLTIKAFAEKWLEEHVKKNYSPSTIETYTIYLEQRIIPALGNIKLKDLQPLHIIKFYNNLKASSLAGATQQKIHRILSSMLNDVVKWQLLVSNPVSRVETPKASKPNRFYYEEEQISALLEALEVEEPKWKTFGYLLLFTGLRKGEALGLEWKDIDFEKYILTVNRISIYTKETGIISKDPKTETSQRSITIPSVLIKLLEKYKAKQNEERLELGDIWEDNDRLFTTWDGKPMFPHSPNTWLNRFLNKNNLPKITIHGLRHTSATLLINEGINIQAVSNRLGHADSSITLRVYSHALKSADEAASKALEAKLLSSFGGMKKISGMNK